MILFCNSKGGFCDKIPCDRTCQFYDGSGSKDVTTRADTIRSMTDEELVECLTNISGYCKSLTECVERLDTEVGIPEDWCKKCLLEWLREPVDATKPATMAAEDKQHSGLIEEE